MFCTALRAGFAVGFAAAAVATPSVATALPPIAFGGYTAQP